MEGFKTLEGEVGYDIRLDDANGHEKFLVNTYGGDLFTGWGIYDYIKNIPNSEIGVMGVCASSGTIILMATSNRWGTKNSKYSIHNPWTYAQGDAQSIAKTAEDLQAEQEKLVSLYETELTLNRDEIIFLMKEDKMIDSTYALEIGLIKEVREDSFEKVEGESAKAMFFNLKRETMNKEKFTKEDSTKIMSGIDKILNKITSILPKKIVNLVLKDTDGIELDFDVDAVEEIIVGTKVTAPDGNYIMEDGTTYVIVSNAVAEIIPPAEDEMAKKDDEIADLKAQLEASTTASAEKDTQIENLNTEMENVKAEVLTIKNMFSKPVNNSVNPSENPEPVSKNQSRTALRKSN